MSNQDLIDQLQTLTSNADALRQDLARSDDMVVLAMAPALVKAVKLNADFAKFARQTRKGIAPLFGKQPDDGGGADQAGDPKPRRPRK